MYTRRMAGAQRRIRIGTTEKATEERKGKVGKVEKKEHKNKPPTGGKKAKRNVRVGGGNPIRLEKKRKGKKEKLGGTGESRLKPSVEGK